ncbi:23S rRNA (adenine(1618)-N(6))-methyltransferase RlmF [Bacterioplanoides sp.]|uniref:23S rRNA (adenine(1618)-N(6))-methyltransferase RlmF n=1 Tax=Bacterioplanoides sp. TaxID=2066072 RepID=UPI003AFFA611
MTSSDNSSGHKVSDSTKSRPLANKRLGRSGEAQPRKPKIQVRSPSAKGARPAKGSGRPAKDQNRVSTAERKVQKPQGLHHRNCHQGRYDMAALVDALPALSDYLTLNPKGEQTIDFADQDAVLCLNQALLQHHYGIDGWQIPADYLCPPIPGRADYIHYAADLMAKYQLSPRNGQARVLDIGTGANLIYSLLGANVYQWQMLACDIDQAALDNAAEILQHNPALATQIQLRLQNDKQSIFRHIIQPGEHYQLSVCNPPFYESAADAQAENRRKTRNLARHQQARTAAKPEVAAPLADSGANSASAVVSNDPWAKAKASPEQRNFGGQNNELWCEGGELAFLKRMARESKEFATQVDWFTSLVSKQEHVPMLLEYLKRQGVKKTEVVKMAQGQKISRFIAWTF